MKNIINHLTTQVQSGETFIPVWAIYLTVAFTLALVVTIIVRVKIDTRNESMETA